MSKQCASVECWTAALSRLEHDRTWPEVTSVLNKDAQECKTVAAWCHGAGSASQHAANAFVVPAFNRLVSRCAVRQHDMAVADYLAVHLPASARRDVCQVSSMYYMFYGASAFFLLVFQLLGPDYPMNNGRLDDRHE